MTYWYVWLHHLAWWRVFISHCDSYIGFIIVCQCMLCGDIRADMATVLFESHRNVCNRQWTIHCANGPYLGKVPDRVPILTVHTAAFVVIALKYL